MKNLRATICIATILAVALAFAGCKTAPKTTETTPVAGTETTVSKPADDALAALRDKAEALRAECLKYHLDAHMVDEWALAEKSRNAGLAAYDSNYDVAKSSFEDAIARYEAIKKASFGKIAAELDAALVAAREAAVAAGAPAYYPDQFALADVAAENSRSLRAEGKDAEAYDMAQVALLRYQTVIKGMEALSLKKKIDENGFIQHAPEECAQAEAKYNESLAAVGTADAAALDAMTESCRLYAKACNLGYKALSQDVIKKADEIRGLCDSVKAKKAVPAEYGKGADLYAAAAKSAQADAWEPAYASYQQSIVAFANAYEAAKLKRNAADAAITQAKQRQDESSALARKADEVTPLPENAEGFSDEPFMIEPAGAPAQAAPEAPAQTKPEAPAQTEPVVPEQPAPAIDEAPAANDPAAIDQALAADDSPVIDEAPVADGPAATEPAVVDEAPASDDSAIIDESDSVEETK